MSERKHSKPSVAESTKPTGYGVPPVHSRWKKGDPSPNPYGRGGKRKKQSPKQEISEFANMLFEELNRVVSFTENGEHKELSVGQLIHRAMSNQAIKGQTSAGLPMLRMLREELEKQRSGEEEVFRMAVETKQRITHYIAHREELGREFRFPIPHPEHIRLDWNDMTVAIVGPLDEDQLHDWLCTIGAMIKAELYFKEAELRDYGCPPEDVEFQREFLDQAREMIPPDDPIWKEYAPAYRRAIVDHRYYYGEGPDLPHPSVPLPKHIMNALRERNRQVDPAVKRAAQKLLAQPDDFRAFMRKKLRSLMGDNWERRLEGEYHELRDVEHDRMRWEYEIGTFDPDNYAFADEEKEALKDPAVLATYMAWE